MQAIVSRLKQSLESYAEKPRDFHNDLEFFFGRGALTLERMITKELFKEMSLRYPPEEELDFETCIGRAKKELLLAKKATLHN